MTTMAASSDARSREDAGSKWLGWVSIGFLGLNLLLLAAVLFLWRYRLPASMGVAREEAAPVASSAEVAAKAEPVSPAPSALRQAPLDEPGTASRQAQPLSREPVKGDSVQGSGTQNAAAPKASPAAPVPVQASGAGSEERTSAAMPSTTTSDTGAQLASPLAEEGVIAEGGIRDKPASLPQGADTVTLPAASLRTADLDNDGDVDIFDVVRYASNPKGTDVNNDGAVNIRDLIVLDASFGLEGP